MRCFSLMLFSGALFAQQPILYVRGVVNAASLVPPGLPNGQIARGSIVSIFGENLGPAQSPALAFPLSATLGGVSLSVTQNGTTVPAYPIYVSPTQINAVMPSSVAAGVANLRLFYQGVKSNAITIQVANSAPGIFAVSSGGFGPGIVTNFVTNTSQPVNSLAAPASPGQVITIWGTGLGPVPYADNIAPAQGNLAVAVSVLVGGQPATVAYSGRSPCCSGLDQVVVTVPANAPLGCWVPVTVNAGGAVSNTVTMAIATAGATACDDVGNPLSKLVRTPGTQAFIHLEQVDDINNIETPTPVTKSLQQVYSRFYTRPNSPFNFDPYMSYPPAGSCLVHQTAGDAFIAKSLRGVLPFSASLPQPVQNYNNGAASFNLDIRPTDAFHASAVGATVDGVLSGMAPLGANGSFTIDPGGQNQTVLPITPAKAPAWARPADIIVVSRKSPLALNFMPGDPAAPTAILLYAYAVPINSTVEVQCLVPPGSSSFTIPSDILANLPSSYRILDGSYAELIIGSLALNKATPFSNGLVTNGLLLNSSWVSQSVVLQ